MMESLFNIPSREGAVTEVPSSEEDPEALTRSAAISKDNKPLVHVQTQTLPESLKSQET